MTDKSFQPLSIAERALNIGARIEAAERGIKRFEHLASAELTGEIMVHAMGGEAGHASVELAPEIATQVLAPMLSAAKAQRLLLIRQLAELGFAWAPQNGGDKATDGEAMARTETAEFKIKLSAGDFPEFVEALAIATDHLTFIAQGGNGGEKAELMKAAECAVNSMAERLKGRASGEGR